VALLNVLSFGIQYKAFAWQLWQHGREEREFYRKNVVYYLVKC